MDTIINKLSEIESAAVAIVTHTDFQKKEYDDLIKQQIEDFDATVSEDTNAEIFKIKYEFQTKMNTELLKLREQNEVMLQAFQKEYDEHHEAYARQILKHIIEV